MGFCSLRHVMAGSPHFKLRSSIYGSVALLFRFDDDSWIDETLPCCFYTDLDKCLVDSRPVVCWMVQKSIVWYLVATILSSQISYLRYTQYYIALF